MSTYIGDFTAGKTVRAWFNSQQADGTPITLAGTPAVSVYKDDSDTQSTSGVTLSVDKDSRTGLHMVAVDTSSDGTFYSAGSDFELIITAGTVDGVSVVGRTVGKFSIANRSALRPTTADRTLTIEADGMAHADVKEVAGTAQTARDIGNALPTAAPGAANGLLISGSNSGTTTLGALTVTGLMSVAGGLAVSSSTSDAVTIVGNGSGSGVSISGGTTGAGVLIQGGAGSGPGLRVITSNGNAVQLQPTAGHALLCQANGTSKHGIYALGGSAGTSDGIIATAGGSGVDIRGNITGNITGTLATVTTLTNLPAITANWLTATGIASNAFTSAKFASGAFDAVWSVAARTLTAGTNIVLPSNGLSAISTWTVGITGNITGNLSGSVGSISGITFPTNFSTLAINASGHVILQDASLVTAKLGTFALAKSVNITGFNDIAATDIVSGGAITTSGGAVSTVTTTGTATAVTTVNGFAANAITAAAIAADAVTEIQNGLATSAQAVKLLAATYDSATLSGSTLTLSNGATMVVSSTGRVTT